MIRISLPEEILQKAAELAAKDHVSVEEFITAAVSEQVAAREYLDQRIRRANKERFQAALQAIPDLEPEPHDRL